MRFNSENGIWNNITQIKGETNGVETEEYQTNLVQNDYDKQKNNVKTSRIIEIKEDKNNLLKS